MTTRNLLRAAALLFLVSGCAPEGAPADAAPASRCDEGERCAAPPTQLLAAGAPYQRYALQTGTSFPETGGTWLPEGNDPYEFLVADNRDLFIIKKRGTGTRSTEVHVLTAASGYKAFSLQTGTALAETGDEFEFGLAGNRNLIAIKKRKTGAGRLEVHILSAASGYRSFVLQTGTALSEAHRIHNSDHEEFEFEIGPGDDLIAIKKDLTTSRMTEVHVLSAASNYQTFSLQTATSLTQTSVDFSFVADRRTGDVYGVQRFAAREGGTGVTELLARDRYQNQGAFTITALEQADYTYAFALAPNRDLFAIKRSKTGTSSTEVHVLAR